MSTATMTRTVLRPLEDRTVLTTDGLVAERPEKKPATPSPGMDDF